VCVPLRRGLENDALDIERAWLAVDHLKNAAVASRGHDAECEARACEALGGAFDSILSLTDLAGKYYYDSAGQYTCLAFRDVVALWLGDRTREKSKGEIFCPVA
jgi:hypothetical protein